MTGPESHAKNNKPLPEKGKKPIIFIAVFFVFLIGVGGVLAFNYFTKQVRTPEERLTDAIFLMMESESGEVRSTFQVKELNIELSQMDEAMMDDLLDDMLIESFLRFDVDTKQIEGSLDLEMMGTSLVTLDYYLNKKKVMIDVPLMYDQVLYISIDDLVTLLQGPILGNMMYGTMGSDDFEVQGQPSDPLIRGEQVTDAIDIVMGIFEKDKYLNYDAVDQKPYKGLMSSYFLEAVDEIEDTEETTRYHIFYDEAKTEYLLEESLRMLSEDLLARAFIEEVINEFFARVIEEENVLLFAALMKEDLATVTPWEGSSFEAELEILRQKTIGELRDNMTDYDEDLKTALTDASEQVDVESVTDSAELEMVFVINDEDSLVSQETWVALNLSDMVGEPSSLEFTLMNTYEAMNGLLEFQGLETVNGLDIGQLSEEELMDLSIEIQNNFLENIMNNPMFSDLFNMEF